MAYSKIDWQNGTLINSGYVEIDGVQYPVTLPRYSGGTPIDATNLNHMDDAIYELYNIVKNVDIDFTTDTTYFENNLVFHNNLDYVSIRGWIKAKSGTLNAGERKVGTFDDTQIYGSFYNLCPVIGNASNYGFGSVVLYLDGSDLYIRNQSSLATTDIIYVNVIYYRMSN